MTGRSTFLVELQETAVMLVRHVAVTHDHTCVHVRGTGWSHAVLLGVHECTRCQIFSVVWGSCLFHSSPHCLEGFDMV